MVPVMPRSLLARSALITASREAVVPCRAGSLGHARTRGEPWSTGRRHAAELRGAGRHGSRSECNDIFGLRWGCKRRPFVSHASTASAHQCAPWMAGLTDLMMASDGRATTERALSSERTYAQKDGAAAPLARAGGMLAGRTWRGRRETGSEWGASAARNVGKQTSASTQALPCPMRMTGTDLEDGSKFVLRADEGHDHRILQGGAGGWDAAHGRRPCPVLRDGLGLTPRGRGQHPGIELQSKAMPDIA